MFLVGAELFHADGQTDMTKVRVAFRNFTNAPQSNYPFWKSRELHKNALWIKYRNSGKLSQLLMDAGTNGLFNELIKLRQLQKCNKLRQKLFGIMSRKISI
jgi:hypothetical protein